MIRGKVPRCVARKYDFGLWAAVMPFGQTLRVPINHPAWSSSMSVLAEGSAEPVSSTDFQVSDVRWHVDRFG